MDLRVRKVKDLLYVMPPASLLHSIDHPTGSYGTVEYSFIGRGLLGETEEQQQQKEVTD
jgi:hypothetical protein